MGVVIPPGYAQAVYRWSLAGDPEEMVTTMGFDMPDLGTLEEHATELYGQAVASGSITPLAAMNQGWTFVGVTLYWRNQASNLQVAVHNEPITQTVGGLATPPNNCALLLQKRTALAGVRFRGRNYLPIFGIGEADVGVTGVILAATYNTIQGRVAGWYANMLANSYTPVLLHSGAETPSPITSLTLATQIATQRRRMRP